MTAAPDHKPKSGSIQTGTDLAATLQRMQTQQEAISTASLSDAFVAGDVEQLAREVTEIVAKALGVERASVWLFNEEETELRSLDLFEATPGRHSSGHVLIEAQYANEFNALKSASYVDADDALTDPRTSGYVEGYLKPLRIISMLDALVQASGRRLGLLCLEHVDKPHHWERDEVHFACQFADKIALALVNRARRDAQNTLRASEVRYRRLFEETRDALMTLEPPDWRFTSGNAAAIRMFGAGTEEQLVSHNPWEASPERQPDGRLSSEKAMEMIQRAIREGSHSFEWTHRRIGGEEFAADVLLTWVSEGADAILYATVRDVTESKRAEEALEASLREKKALLREVHHRVKNNLQVITSLLRLEAGRSSEPGTRAVLKEMQGRILSLALLHETLYRSGDFGRVDLAGYLRQLAEQVFRAQNPGSGLVRLDLELRSAYVGIDQAIPCGLIVNELLTNSLKHGFTGSRGGEVRVVARPQGEGQVHIAVSDNGAGLPPDFEARSANSLGMQLVSDLARQIGGRLEIGPSPLAAFAVTFTPTSPRSTGPTLRPPPEPA